MILLEMNANSAIEAQTTSRDMLGLVYLTALPSSVGASLKTIDITRAKQGVLREQDIMEHPKGSLAVLILTRTRPTSLITSSRSSHPDRDRFTHQHLLTIHPDVDGYLRHAKAKSNLQSRFRA